MKKTGVLIYFAFLILMLPAVSADVGLNEKAINNIIIKELSSPAKFDITISNDNSYDDNFMIDTLLDIDISPHDEIFVEADSEKTVTREISPSSAIRAAQDGIFSFEYYADGDRSGVKKGSIPLEFVSLKDLILTELPLTVSNDDEEIVLKIKLSKDMNIDADLTLVSELLSYEQSVSLDKDGIERAVPLNAEMPKAGTYEVKMTFTIDGYEYAESKDIVLEPIVNLEEISEKTGNFLSYTASITKENTGNSVTDATITVNKALISSMFTSFDIKPNSVKRSGNSIVYEFTKELNPNEKLAVNAKTSYYLPLAILILLVIAVWILIVVLTPQVKVQKKAVKVRTSSGVFATKIVLSIKNKGREVTDLKIIDRLPAFTELVPEKFGTISPTEIRKKILIWHVDKLAQNEEILLSYIVYSKLTVIGTLAVPISFATYKDAKGNMHESRSNASSVLVPEEQQPSVQTY